MNDFVLLALIFLMVASDIAYTEISRKWDRTRLEALEVLVVALGDELDGLSALLESKGNVTPFDEYADGREAADD